MRVVRRTGNNSNGCFLHFKYFILGTRARTRTYLDCIKKVAVKNRIIEEQEAFLIQRIFNHSKGIQSFRQFTFDF